jgi:hypothetical protein
MSQLTIMAKWLYMLKQYYFVLYCDSIGNQ